MPPGSELSIVSAEPAASATHFGSGVLLSITLHAAAVAVAVGTGWWMDHRVNVPIGHASEHSAQAIELTASVSQTDQAAAVQIMQVDETEELDSKVVVDRDFVTDLPVDKNIWDQAAQPLHDLVAEELHEAVRQELAKSKSDSRKAQAAPEAAPETATSSASDESQAAIAAQTIGAQVDVVAKPRPTNQPPRFPAAALREGRSGRVVLRVSVSSKGVVTRMVIIKTSGHSDLDQAAMDGVARWSFEPARRLGLPIAQDIAVPISFEFE